MQFHNRRKGVIGKSYAIFNNQFEMNAYAQANCYKKIMNLFRVAPVLELNMMLRHRKIVFSGKK
jgi:hypothetical protein